MKIYDVLILNRASANESVMIQIFISALLVFASQFASAATPELKIKVGDLSRSYTRDELLKSPAIKQLTIENDPTYSGQKMTYTVIPVSALFADFKIEADSTLLFNCLDGFSAALDPAPLLNKDTKKAIAYIAIEDPSQPWPKIKKRDNLSAGPFYLVWENPEKSKISQEEWPFQLAGFEMKPSLAQQFPKTVPRAKSSSEVQAGYKLFMKNCFACHTMNGDGTSQMGPDLNIPHGPTEYMKEKFIFQLIRNPQSVRHWPQSKMSAFSPQSLSDKDIRHIIRYLEHMAAGRR